MTAFVFPAQGSRQVGMRTAVALGARLRVMRRRGRSMQEIVATCQGARAAVVGLDQEAGVRAQEWGVAAPIRHVSAPVQGEAVVRRLASGGVTTYVEVGPGTALSGRVLHNIHREATSISVGGLDDLATVESAIHV